MLKTGENIDGPGRMPACRILTVKERIGKDLTLDEKPLRLWINVKYVLDKNTNLTLRLETVTQPFFKQLLRRQRLFKNCGLIPLFQYIFVGCAEKFFQSTLAFPGGKRAEMLQRMTCNCIKKCNCTFVLNFVGQLRHVLSGKAFRRLIQCLAMSFLFGLPRCRSYVIELNNEMLHGM